MNNNVGFHVSFTLCTFSVVLGKGYKICGIVSQRSLGSLGVSKDEKDNWAFPNGCLFFLRSFHMREVVSEKTNLSCIMNRLQSFQMPAL